MALINKTQQKYYRDGEYGDYQFTSLENIINQFMVAYVGEEKVISRANRSDIAFHAQRALAELSFDTLKSIKAQEITVPATLQMILPQDYVNYTKISCVDSAGIKHRLYPTLCNTSNPSNPLQNTSGDFELSAIGTFPGGSTITLDKEYSNIYAGMIIESSIVPGNRSTIINWSTDGTRTSISVGDFAPTTFAQFSSLNYFSTSTAVSGNDFTIQIKNPNGELIPSPNSSYTANNVPFLISSNFLTLPAADVANLEVGMIVHGQDLISIPPNTTITAINGNNIVLSNTTDSVNVGTIDINFVSPISDSDTWGKYKSTTPSENNRSDYEDDIFWALKGGRYGIDPQHAQANGSFYIDNISGKIHFSSNISGKTVILDYISDSLGTDEEMQVHKFAEEAMYKSIAYAVLSTRANTQEYIVRRYKKEKFAETRKAKLRLSNIKLEEITQIFRGKSKQIKH